MQYLTEISNQIELVLNLLGRFGPPTLVVGRHRVTECSPRQVEGDGDGPRLLRAN